MLARGTPFETRREPTNMDGEFTCPECGHTVKAPPPSGPGRQARCEFCGRLLEVPFLPRIETGFKGSRKSTPGWVPWTWWGIAFVVVCLVAVGAVQLILVGERAGRVRSIERMIAESKASEAEGRIGQALTKLDQALELLPAVQGRISEDPAAVRERRRSLAVRDANNILTDLQQRGGSSATLGEWLNLAARAEADPDLAPLRRDVETRFQKAMNEWVDREEAAAKSEAAADRPRSALDHASSAVEAATQLPPAEQAKALERIDAVVVPLIERRGVAVDFLDEGAENDASWYATTMKPELVQTLEERGYLPPARASRWDDVWSRAPFRLSLATREHREGSYLESQNRLTRVEARLELSRRGVELWKSTPTARTSVPASGLSSFVSSRLALSRNRSEEVEDLLRADARRQIVPRLQAALKGLPAPPAE